MLLPVSVGAALPKERDERDIEIAPFLPVIVGTKRPPPTDIVYIIERALKLTAASIDIPSKRRRATFFAKQSPSGENKVSSHQMKAF